MSNYALRGAPPTTLTLAELRAVLRATGERSETYRDHVLISVAVGTGLREHEIAALDVGDVVPAGGDEIRRRVTLRVFKGHARAKRPQRVILPDECRRKLELWTDRLWVGGRLELTAPLFPSRQGGGRLSTRQIRELWKRWQVRAGLERHHPFHALRHTFVSNVYAREKCLITAQRLARHRRVETTTIYAHVGDEGLERAARGLPS